MVLNHSFSEDQTSFLVKLLKVSFFPLWPKTSWQKSKSFIFFSSIVFQFGSHSLTLLVQAGLVKPIRNAASTRYIAAATCLHVSLIPAYMCNGRSLFLLSFQVLSKVCGMDPLLTEVFYILLWWYSIYFLNDYGIAKVEAILIYSNCMLYYSYSH